jgi:hypothetical protein
MPRAGGTIMPSADRPIWLTISKSSGASYGSLAIANLLITRLDTLAYRIV